MEFEDQRNSYLNQSISIKVKFQNTQIKKSIINIVE